MFYKIAGAFVRFFCRLYFRMSIEGIENIPKTGGLMLCMNHYSLWEPALIGAFFPRRVFFVAKEELLKTFFIGPILKSIGTVPIKRGTGDIGAIKASMNVLNSDKVLGIFPSGKRVKIDEDPNIKSGVSLIATKTGTTVLPVYIQSKYKIGSKTKIIIGKSMDFSQYKGKKLSMDEITQLSHDIYGNIMSLKEEGI